MNPELWKKAQELYARTVDLPEDQQRDFVVTAAADDSPLREEVLRLLQRPAPRNFLAPPESSGAPAPSLTGSVLDDYELLGELGRGGMGVVYRAKQRSLGRVVALKVLPSVGLGERQVQRFERESRAVARLEHPNIITIHHVGNSEGTRYFSMEYVEGTDLGEEIARLRRELGDRGLAAARLPAGSSEPYFHAVARIVRDLARALAYAHDKGIVHRDVKPTNTLLSPDGTVKLVDFGLARDEAQGAITHSQEWAGTPWYMSPEQAESRLRKVDLRTDVYSAGVVLYELLTLQRPFRGETSYEVIQGILRRPAVAVRQLEPEVPVDLETICGKAMARVRDRRYPTATALADDLDRFLRHEAIRAQRPRLAHRVLDFGRCHAAPLKAAASVFTVLMGIWLAHSWWSELQDEHSLIQRTEDFLADSNAEAAAWARFAAEFDEHRRRHGDGSEELARLEQRFHRERELTSRSCDFDVDQALGDYQRTEAEVDLVRAVDAAARRQRIRGEPSEEILDEFQRALTAPVQIQVDSPLDFEIHVQELDVWGEPGPARRIDRRPASPPRFAPGVLRFTVVAADGSFAERDLRIRERSAREIRLRPRPADRAPPGMRRVDGRRVRSTYNDLLDLEARTTAPHTIQREVPPFWIDIAPVSNADYAAAVDAGIVPEPELWRLLPDPRPADWGERPVVHVPLEHARRYAASRGARLPSLAEWELAVLGPGTPPYPWGEDFDAALAATYNLGRPRLHGQGQAPNLGGTLDWVLQNVRAVRRIDGPEGGPHRLHDVVGNVREWVETWPLRMRGGGSPLPVHSMSYAVGHSAETTLARFQSAGLAPRISSFEDLPQYAIGFRCARSAEPFSQDDR